MIETSTFRAGRAIVGVIIGVFAQALVLGAAAFLAGRLVKPQGGGFEDLAAVLSTLVIGEVVVALSCLIVGIVQIVRGKRDLGAGLIVGWLVGGVVGFLVLQAG